MSFSITESQCYFCKHLVRDGEKVTLRCAAFARIPNEIIGITDEDHPEPFDHRQPYPGDNGIRWEPIKPGGKHPLEETRGNGDPGRRLKSM